MDVEYELGVAIPGRILPPEQWTRTALKKLPPPGPFDWQALFGRTAPRVVDVGCGNGRFVLASALRRPEVDHLGLDILPVVLRYATRRANQRGLANVRLAACGGHEFLERYFAPRSIDEIHVYHPQPYGDAQKKERRLLTPAFLALVHRSLVPNGLFAFQTDNPAYWRYAASVAPALFDWRERTDPWPEDPEGRTRREIMARRMGLRIFRASGTPRQVDDLDQLVARLPAPTFDGTPPRRRRRRR